ncbi:hypothetical protein [Thalassobacillus devorans]|uniref:hypothetical protein n=1 Tax=Thalassobacillus devorans TaxID=279813 RepID=UPI00048EF47A|nr:hypothetical protein [Thalassobacillus devorans]
MKQNDHKNDTDLQRQLGQMPAIHDHQAKDELYDKISVHMKESKPDKKKSDFLPVFAFITVLLLAAIITPAMMMNRSNDELNSSESQNYEAATESGISENTEESAELFETQDEGKVTEQNLPVSDFESHLVFEMDEGANYVASVAAGSNAEHIIPLTIKGTDSNAVFRKVTASAAKIAERLGVSFFPLEGAEIIAEGETGEIIFSKDFQTQGSSSDVILQRSIEHVFRQYGVSEVKLSYEDGRPFEMGNYGIVESMKVSPDQKVSYKIYRSSESNPILLAPIELNENASIDEAVEIMASPGGGEYIYSPLPDGVEVDVNENSGHELLIRVKTTGQLQANQKAMTMIEALLATAASFGYEQVQFEGLPFAGIRTYDFTEPIATPEAVNPISIEE